MARRVFPGVKAAQASGRAASVGVRAARRGLRIVGRLTHETGGRGWRSAPDPWLAPRSLRWNRNDLTQRAGGLLRLVLGGLLAAAMLSALVLVLLVFALQGSGVAAWLLVATLLLGALALFWGLRRAGRLLRGPMAVAAGPASGVQATLAQDEAGLLNTLRTHQRILPPGSREVFQSAVLATRDAMRLTAGDVTLGRDAYDARQAAREDLPEVLRAYRAAPRTAHSDEALLGQLRLIEGRMQQVIETRTAGQVRALKAHGRYLEDKYAGPADRDPEKSA
ncbi:hypothetical protein [Deinococcus navajonensis]|uniref:5-bromo-4-chloroindolyl phosphate hydrolysis protein n=1 Tax=Deinococcus navajonensis TaxID=309884 RepID=A0ABV8XKM8_9DEIO